VTISSRAAEDLGLSSGFGWRSASALP